MLQFSGTCQHRRWRAAHPKYRVGRMAPPKFKTIFNVLHHCGPVDYFLNPWSNSRSACGVLMLHKEIMHEGERLGGST